MNSKSWWSRRSRRNRYAASAPMPQLQAGQVWRYRTRPGEEDSRATILVLELLPEVGDVVHIRIDGVHIPNPVDPSRPNTVVGHAPIDGAAFLRSVTELVGVDPQEPDLEGYRQWHEAGGGVFGLPIDETVAAVEATLAGGTYTAWIDDNVSLALDSLSSHVDFDMGLDRRSLVWVEGFLERQRDEPEIDAQRLVSVLGSFLGQCLVVHGSGEWRQDDNGWYVRLPGGDARPFDTVDKQARLGLAGGESIVSFFDGVLALSARHRDAGD